MQIALKPLMTPAARTSDSEVLLTIPVGSSVLLQNVTWQAVEKILVELGDSRATRLAYDRGSLEIIAPLPEHEYYQEAIADLVKDLADELNIDILIGICSFAYPGIWTRR